MEPRGEQRERTRAAAWAQRKLRGGLGAASAPPWPRAPLQLTGRRRRQQAAGAGEQQAQRSSRSGGAGGADGPKQRLPLFAPA